MFTIKSVLDIADQEFILAQLSKLNTQGAKRIKLHTVADYQAVFKQYPNLSPHPIFDLAYYETQLTADQQQQRLREKLTLVEYFVKNLIEKTVYPTKPSPFFDWQYYADQIDVNVEVGLENFLLRTKRKLSLAAASHKPQHAAENWVDPSPLFNAAYYRDQLSEIMQARQTDDPIELFRNFILNFLSPTFDQAVSPSPLINLAYYAKQQGLKIENALQHFIYTGMIGGCSPSPWIDVKYYAACYQLTTVAALQHFFTTGLTAGLSPSPFIDPEYCQIVYKVPRQAVVTEFFLKKLVTIDKAILEEFNPVEKRLEYDRLSPSPLLSVSCCHRLDKSLTQYLIENIQHTTSPNDFFDLDFYANEYTIARSDAVMHYATLGMQQGNRPNLFFDPAYYVNQYQVEITTAFRDFMIKTLMPDYSVNAFPLLDVPFINHKLVTGNKPVVAERKPAAKPIAAKSFIYADFIKIHRAYSQVSTTTVANYWSPCLAFDAKYYAAQAGISESQALMHYMLQGRYTTHLKIHPYIDLEYYYSQVKKKVALGIIPAENNLFAIENAFIHFLTFADQLNISPSPFFDWNHYSKHYKVEEKVFNHFLVTLLNPKQHKIYTSPFCCLKRAKPHDAWQVEASLLFDSAYYITQANLITVEPIAALSHFLTQGQYAELDPCLFFNNEYYKAQLPRKERHAIQAAGSSLIMHYISNAQELKTTTLQPCCLFDADYYHQQLALNSSIQPAAENFSNTLLEAFLYQVQTLSHTDDQTTVIATLALASPYFEPVFYANQAGISIKQALWHFLSTGIDNGIACFSLFDTAYYAANNNLARNKAIQHFLTVGDRQGISPSPFFDSHYYVSELEKKLKQLQVLQTLTKKTAANEEEEKKEAEKKTGDHSTSPSLTAASQEDITKKIDCICEFYQLNNQNLAKELKKIIPGLSEDIQLIQKKVISACHYFLSKGQFQHPTLSISPLIDIRYYQYHNPQLKPTIAAILHDWLTQAAMLAKSCSPLVNANYYRQQLKRQQFENADLIASTNIIRHAFSYGIEKGIDLSGYFQVSYYANRYKVAAKQVYNDFFTQTTLAKAPFFLFETDYYLQELQKQNDAESEDALLCIELDLINPAYHFICEGNAKGLSPSILFDREFYAKTYQVNPDNAFTHFIHKGVFLGYSCFPLFNAAFYAKRYAVAEKQAIRDFLTTGERLDRDPGFLFDSFFYHQQLEKLLKNLTDQQHDAKDDTEETVQAIQQLSDFLKPKAGTQKISAIKFFLFVAQNNPKLMYLSPSPFFDPEIYLKNLETARIAEFTELAANYQKTGVFCLMQHFIEQGMALAISPSEWIDVSYYQQICQQPTSQVLQHFFSVGMPQGASASPYFDENFYEKRYKLTDKKTIYQHFFSENHDANCSTFFLFNAEFYVLVLQQKVNYQQDNLQANLVQALQDIKQGKLTALQHFMRYGRLQRISPSPYFDYDFYQANTTIANQDSLYDFLIQEAKNALISASPFIDLACYEQQLQKNSALYIAYRNQKISLFRHFVLYGEAQNISPCPFFDGEFTRAQVKADPSYKQYADWPIFRYYLLAHEFQLVNAPKIEYWLTTPLLDQPFYYQQLNVANAQDKALQDGNMSELYHFLSYGEVHGYQLTPFFDSEYYLIQLQEAKIPQDNLSPIRHFILQGISCFAPNVYYDIDFYTNALQATAEAAFWFFIKTKGHDGQSTHPLFHNTFYLIQCGIDPSHKKNIAGQSPIQHYLLTGEKQNLSINPFIDIQFYKSKLSASQQVDIDRNDWSLCKFYLLVDQYNDPVTSLCFDCDYYRQQRIKLLPNTAIEKGLLADYYKIGMQNTIPASPFFVADFYQSQLSVDLEVIQQLKLNWLEHFAIYGLNAGLVALPLFNTDYYLAQLHQQQMPNIPAKNLAFKHFMALGCGADYAYSPFFNAQHYERDLQTTPDVENKRIINKESLTYHYLRYGLANNNNPSLFVDLRYYKRHSTQANFPADQILLWPCLQGLKNGNQPTAWFNNNDYVAELKRLGNTETAQQIEDRQLIAIEHFITQGISQQLQPSFLYEIDYTKVKTGNDLTPNCIKLNPLFDMDFYLAQLNQKTQQRLGRDPLKCITHFLEHGQSQGYNPCALFNVEYYSLLSGIALDQAFQHYLSTPATSKPEQDKMLSPFNLANINPNKRARQVLAWQQQYYAVSRSLILLALVSNPAATKPIFTIQYCHQDQLPVSISLALDNIADQIKQHSLYRVHFENYQKYLRLIKVQAKLATNQNRFTLSFTRQDVIDAMTKPASQSLNIALAFFKRLELLVSHDFDSIFSIYATQKEVFLKVAVTIFPTTPSSFIINFYNQAKMMGAELSLLFLQSEQILSPMSQNKMLAQGSKQAASSHQEILGTQDYLNLDEDNSIYSPQAYLFELLRFINNPKYLAFNDDKFSLAARRNDILNLKLTYANAYTTIPYLQIVNAVLAEGVRSGLYPATPPAKAIATVFLHLISSAAWFAPPLMLPTFQINQYLNSINLSSYELAQVGRTKVATYDEFLNQNLTLILTYLNIDYCEFYWLRHQLLNDKAKDKNLFMQMLGKKSADLSDELLADFQCPAHTFAFLTQMQREEYATLIPYGPLAAEPQNKIYENYYINSTSDQDVVQVILDDNGKQELVVNLSKARLQRIAFVRFFAQKFAISLYQADNIIMCVTAKNQSIKDDASLAQYLLAILADLAILKQMAVAHNLPMLSLVNALFHLSQSEYCRLIKPQLDPAQIVINKGYTADSDNFVIAIESLLKANQNQSALQSVPQNIMQDISMLTQLFNLSVDELLNLFDQPLIQRLNNNKLVFAWLYKMTTLATLCTCHITNLMRLCEMQIVGHSAAPLAVTPTLLFEYFTNSQYADANQALKNMLTIIEQGRLLNKSKISFSELYKIITLRDMRSKENQLGDQNLLDDIKKLVLQHQADLATEKQAIAATATKKDDEKLSQLDTTVVEKIAALYKVNKDLILLVLRSLADVWLKKHLAKEVVADKESILRKHIIAVFVLQKASIFLVDNQNQAADSLQAALASISVASTNLLLIRNIAGLLNLLKIAIPDTSEGKKIIDTANCHLFINQICHYFKQDNPNILVTLEDIRLHSEIKALRAEDSDVNNIFIYYLQHYKLDALSQYYGWPTRVTQWLTNNSFGLSAEMMDVTVNTRKITYIVQLIKSLQFDIAVINKLGGFYETVQHFNRLWQMLSVKQLEMADYTFTAFYKKANHIAKLLEKSIVLPQKNSNLDSYRNINRVINEKMRDYLVGIIKEVWQKRLVKLALPMAADDLETSVINIANDTLSQYILLDVDMTGEFDTSYISEAINSLELLLQRCRMHVEPQISIVDQETFDKWFPWLSAYKVWKANRQVLMHPENYLEPDLRKEQSPEFINASQALQQSNLSKESLQDLTINLFNATANIANLVYCDACAAVLPNASNTSQLYFFAHTPTTPYTFYYQSMEYDNNDITSARWHYWQKIDLSINSNFITPVYAFGKLFIFWSEATVAQHKASEVEKGNNFAVKPDEFRVKYKIHYSWKLSSSGWQKAALLCEQDNIDATSFINIGDKSKVKIFNFREKNVPIGPCLPVTLAKKEQVLLRFDKVSIINNSLSAGVIMKSHIIQPTQMLQSVIKSFADLPEEKQYQNLTNTSHNIIKKVQGLKDTLIEALLLPLFNKRNQFSAANNTKVSEVKSTAENLQASTNGLCSKRDFWWWGPLAIQNIIQYQRLIELINDMTTWLALEQDLGGDIDRANLPKMIHQFKKNLNQSQQFIAKYAQIFTDFETILLCNPESFIFFYDILYVTYYQQKSILAAKLQTLKNGWGQSLATFDKQISQLIEVILGLEKLKTSLKTTKQAPCQQALGSINVVMQQLNSINLAYNNQPELSDSTTIQIQFPILSPTSTAALSQQWLQPQQYQIGSDLKISNHNQAANMIVDNDRLNSQFYPAHLAYPEFAVTISNQALQLGVSLAHASLISVKDNDSLAILVDKQFAYLIQTTDNEKNTKLYLPLSSAEVFSSLATALQQGQQSLIAKLPQVKNSSFKDLEPNATASCSTSADGEIDFNGSFGNYFWELFFYFPFLTAKYLTDKGHFEDARAWYHCIFNPYAKPQQSLFLFPPFQNIHKQANSLEVSQSILRIYHDNLFDADGIARLRPLSYMRAVAMHYINNLIEWGDYFFTLDTREEITLAINLYMIAKELLGDKPQALGKKMVTDDNDAMSFADYKSGTIKIDPYNAWKFNALENTLQSYDNNSLGNIDISEFLPYFTIPENKDFFSLWETVGDRLFKIRHCLNINGMKQQLDLYAPDLDVRQLVRAAAAGGSSGDLIRAMIPAPQPIYRFQYMLQKARVTVNAVMQIGSAVLAGLERQDNESLAQLMNKQQSQLLEMLLAVKQQQLDLADLACEQADNDQQMIQNKEQRYKKLTAVKMSSAEIVALGLSSAQIELSAVVAGLNTAASIVNLMPSIGTGFSGIGPYIVTKISGQEFSQSIAFAAGAVSAASEALGLGSEIALRMDGYDRRMEEWQFQLAQIGFEKSAAEKRAKIAKIQRAIAQADYDQQQSNIDQLQDVLQFYQDKFTNLELYRWYNSQIGIFYRQLYDMAVSTCRAAEQAYQFELNDPKTDISQSHYSVARNGLLAGEGLLVELTRLEKAFLENNIRRYEIRKVVSLRQHLAKANNDKLIDHFDHSGSINFSFSQEFFDADFPGHSTRMIKQIRFTTLALLSPFQSINLLCRQVSYSIDGKKITQNLQTITLTSGNNETGVVGEFLGNERYYPFENTGAISEWQICIANPDKIDDLKKINDIVINLDYSAKPAGIQNNNAASDSSYRRSAGATFFGGSSSSRGPGNADRAANDDEKENMHSLSAAP